MSDPQAQLQCLQGAWDTCQANDDQKHTLIKNLFTYVENLSSRLSEAEYELRDKKDVIKLTRSRIEEAEKQIQALQIEKGRHAFASVLIDGDCMLFKDGLVKAGLDGGKKAAGLLKQAVKEELRSSSPAVAHHIQVVIRVYANMKGLAKTYKDMEILPQSASFDEFVRGFNMGDPMCDFVDAGNGKECSDEKIKAMFRHDIADIHCQRILFGGSADNGYARLLGPLTEDDAVRSRITLLEGPPFARELADIKNRYRTVSFERVFRCETHISPKRPVSSLPTPPRTPSTGYETIAVQTPSATSPTTPPSSTISTHAATGLVSLNRSGERVDPPLDYTSKEFSAVKSRKLCNTFHLLGKCSSLVDFGKCQHDHDAKLSNKQLVALRAVARLSPCQKGRSCKDLECLNGHRCIRKNCSRSNCWFPKEMHNVSVDIVTRV